MPTTIQSLEPRGSKKAARNAFLLNDENAAPAKGKKEGSQKNPNKKKGKKLARREREALELSEAKAVPASTPRPAANRNRSMLAVIKQETMAVRSPLVRPQTNSFEVLVALGDAELPDCSSSPTPSLSSPKISIGDNLLDVLELVGDLDYVPFLDFSWKIPHIPEVAVVEAPAVVVEKKPDGLFIKAFRLVGRALATVAAAAVAVVSVFRSCF